MPYTNFVEPKWSEIANTWPTNFGVKTAWPHGVPAGETKTDSSGPVGHRSVPATARAPLVLTPRTSGASPFLPSTSSDGCGARGNLLRALWLQLTGDLAHSNYVFIVGCVETRKNKRENVLLNAVYSNERGMLEYEFLKMENIIWRLQFAKILQY